MYLGWTTSVRLFAGKGKWQFQFVDDPRTPPRPFRLIVQDFNADGVGDFAVTSNESDFCNAVAIAMGDGDGGFDPMHYYGVGDGGFSLTTGDFNTDGRPDLLTANSDSDDFSVLVSIQSSEITIGDVNGDCRVDLLDVEPFVELLSAGGFSEAADVNQDGKLNLLDVSAFVELIVN